MKVKRFEGATEQAVIEQVQRELGPGASIVSIKSIRDRGFLGIFKKPRVEVMAAYDEAESELGLPEASSAELSEHQTLLGKTAKHPAKHPKSAAAVSQADQEQALKDNQAFAAGLREKYKEQLLEEQAEKIKQLEKNVLTAQEMLSRMNAKLAADHNKQAAQARFKNQIVEMLYATLLEQGVLDYVAEAMLEGLDVEAGPDGEKAGESPDAGLLVRMVYTKIISIIGKPNVAFENRSVSASEIVSDQPESEPDDPDGSKAQNENEAGATKPAGKVRKKKSAKPKKPFVAAFIGPTGVGKTTTIAKLSADFILNKNARVSLISADTYRIAAVEQLRTYADILDIDLGVVYNPEDMREQLSAASGVDVVLIDTAGRSHRHGENMAELKALLESAEICHKYLVLSLTTKFEDMVEIVETFSDISDFNIIFTKLDETKTVGSVLNLCYHTGKTVSYITFGQNVPNDIRVLQPEEIARLILCGTSSVLT